MFADIESNKIGVILCKDLSRFGRNNAMVAYYTELFLPQRDVRLICVNDAIDTGVGDNEIMPFKSVINEYYARDISKKVRSAKRVQAMRGEMCNGHAPYGYVTSPHDKHKLVIDEESAKNVRWMFQLASDGFGVHQIAKKLCAAKILIPAAYNLEKLGKRKHLYNPEYPYDWMTTTVKRILVNRAYVGDMCQHKYTNKSYKFKQIVYVPEEEWIIVPDTHEAIVDRITFEKVQRLVKYRKRANSQNIPNLFAGILVCADCGGSLSFKAPKPTSGSPEGQYMCNKYNHSPKSEDGRRSCTAHYTPLRDLRQIVQERLNDIFVANLTVESIVKRLGENDDEAKVKQLKLDKLKRRDKDVKQVIQKIVEQHALGEIAKETFADLYAKYLSEQETLTAEIAAIEKEFARPKNEAEIASLFIETIRKYTVVEELTREILLDTIEKIVVHEANGASRWEVREQVIEIHYRFVGRLPEDIG